MEFSQEDGWSPAVPILFDIFHLRMINSTSDTQACLKKYSVANMTSRWVKTLLKKGGKDAYCLALKERVFTLLHHLYGFQGQSSSVQGRVHRFYLSQGMHKRTYLQAFWGADSVLYD